MNVIRCVTKFIVLAALLLAGSGARAAESSVAPAMMGHWEGDARIIVSWCHQTNLHLSIDIHADGTVTGKVGDATVLKGRLERNRGFLGRKLNLATDHIIRGQLDGAVVAAEGISRKSVSIPLNFTGGTFVGGLHTSGSKFGGKQKAILSASSLTLNRSK